MADARPNGLCDVFGRPGCSGAPRGPGFGAGAGAPRLGQCILVLCASTPLWVVLGHRASRLLSCTKGPVSVAGAGSPRQWQCCACGVCASRSHRAGLATGPSFCFFQFGACNSCATSPSLGRSFTGCGCTRAAPEIRRETKKHAWWAKPNNCRTLAAVECVWLLSTKFAKLYRCRTLSFEA